MMRAKTLAVNGLILLSLGVSAIGCKDKENVPGPKELPDLSQHTFPYTTIENTRVRTGPGTEFRSIAEIAANAKVNVVGRDGDWVLIVSKKGNAPGFVEMAAVKAADASVKQTLNPQAEGKYEAVAETSVRSGPGLHYPVVAKVSKGTKLNVVEEENGWLKVESKRGNEPGYVEASFTKPASD
ncbi:MAG: SH3 domain-containing protein [Candidatus Binatia bacterium]